MPHQDSNHVDEDIRGALPTERNGTCYLITDLCRFKILTRVIKISESLCLTDFYKIIVYVQHLLMEMVLLIPPELLQPDYNHGILEQWAANVTDAQFEEVKIPSKYRLLLRKVDQVSVGSEKIWNDC